MRKPAQPTLDTAQVVVAAFAQLEDDGLDGLSMRRVAERLGVQAPALYWHVGDKAELLGLMASEIYVSGFTTVPAATTWREWLTAYGRALRATFARHRDGARLCSIARPASRADPAAHARLIAAPLVALGLTATQAISFQAAIISYTLGWATFEANGPMHQFLDQMLDFDSSFSNGLEALVSGFDRASHCQ